MSESGQNKGRLVPLLVSTVGLLALGACATSGPDAAGARKDARSAQVEKALENAMVTAAEKAGQPLPALERDYKRNSKNPEVAMAYARALREDEQLNKAVIVLSPFARESEASSPVLSEFAAIQLAIGDYETAETFARKAILKDAKNFRAYQVLGIALDGRGYSKQAEVAFRKGLDLWEGDPTTIMNNLALNLVSQGELDEASQILQRAAAAAPNRPEIERNLRIVTALQQQPGPPRAAAKLPKKPKK